MNRHTILIIGGGGREHALAWKLSQSPKIGKIYIAPGNAGTALVGENVPIPATDIPALLNFALENKIDLSVVGQDDPLALGVVNAFKKKSLKIWGPSKKAAQVESSKAFAKDLMQQFGIPTAHFQTFNNYDGALRYVENHFSDVAQALGLPSAEQATGLHYKPIVIKASGLALGKGVTVCKTLTEARAALKAAMVDKVFGEAGNQVIIEEFLEGQEFSIHAFCDGKTFKLLPASQDHKPIFDGGLGPNTGGMGTIAPVPWVSAGEMESIAKNIITPALKGIKKLANPFVGLLYPGLIQTAQGPKVIEFNARFGDPETQSYMRLLKTDLFDIFRACVDGTLSDINIEWHPGFACCIVLASGGYPGEYKKGLPISGIDDAEKMDDVIVFQAGTKMNGKNLVTNGGRVLGITATDTTLKGALDKAYAAVKLISFEGMQYRKDIGAKSLVAT